jgi:hypothetical protein
MLGYYDHRLHVKQLTWNHFRGGWRLAYEFLKTFQHKQHALLYANLDYQVEGLTNGGEPYPWHLEPIPTRPWVGIIHGPNCVIDDLFATEWWDGSKKLCLGLFCLSRSYINHIKSRSDLKTEKIFMPLHVSEVRWTKTDQFLSVGMAYRDVEFIESLPFNVLSFNSFSATVRLGDQEYDELLSKSAVVVRLTEPVVANIMLDCLAVKTPLFINRNAVTEEYLGIDYPLLYSSYEECVGLLADDKLQRVAHEYLCVKDNSRHDINNFKSTIINSKLWRT